MFFFSIRFETKSRMTVDFAILNIFDIQLILLFILYSHAMIDPVSSSSSHRYEQGEPKTLEYEVNFKT